MSDTSDTILERAQQFLADRVAIGEARYGRTLDDNPASVLERLQHLKEELGDGLQYVIWAEDEIARLQRADEALSVAKAGLDDVMACEIGCCETPGCSVDNPHCTYQYASQTLQRIREIQEQA